MKGRLPPAFRLVVLPLFMALQEKMRAAVDEVRAAKEAQSKAEHAFQRDWLEKRDKLILPALHEAESVLRQLFPRTGFVVQVRNGSSALLECDSGSIDFTADTKAQRIKATSPAEHEGGDVYELERLDAVAIESLLARFAAYLASREGLGSDSFHIHW